MRFWQGGCVAVFLMAGAVQAAPPAPPVQEQAQPPAGTEPPPMRSLESTDGPPSTAPCPGLHSQMDAAVSPLVLIVEGPLPQLKPERAPTESEVKCVESLRAAGQKEIGEGKAGRGTAKYLAAVNVALPLAWATYRELAFALDKTAHPDPAIAAYRKAWAAIEIEDQRPGAKHEGVTVLAMAEIRDSIVRLGGQIPSPTSEVGRIVVANPTRKLQEQYFDKTIPLPK
ncbi:MAG: hypothetical protein EPO02_05440 [Nitrospirae bacterium]|nr:MAG: hypothetical protein EPO02_05440 [Nitrospirota bacterium]